MYLTSSADFGPINEYIIKDVESKFYKYFIMRCHQALNDNSSTFKAKKRSLDYLTKFKISEDQTANILAELGYRNLLDVYAPNTVNQTSNEQHTNSSSETSSNYLIDSLRLLSQQDYLSNLNSVYFAALDHRLKYECELRGVYYDRYNIIKSSEDLILTTKIGMLTRSA